MEEPLAGTRVLVIMISAVAVFAIMVIARRVWAGFIVMLIGLAIGVGGQTYSIWWWVPAWVLLIFGAGIMFKADKN